MDTDSNFVTVPDRNHATGGALHRSPTLDAPRERTSLELESTGTRVRTEVVRRTPERITVTQALPFLKLKSGVRDADGRAASIEWVSVDIEGDTPALIMELVYDAPVREDQTEETRAAAAPIVIGEPTRTRPDETAPYTFERAEARLEIAIAGTGTSLAPVAPNRSWLAALVHAWGEIRDELARAFRQVGRLFSVALFGG